MSAQSALQHGSYSYGLRGYKCGVDNPSFWKGKSIPDEVKVKMSMAHKGRKFSDEHKKALSDSHKGKKFADEHKKNLSIAQRKRVLAIKNQRCLLLRRDG